jgi:hypothetical protein
MVAILIHLHVVTLSGLGVVANLHQAPAGGVHETLSGALPMIVLAVYVRLVAPSREEDRGHHESPTRPQVDDAEQGTVHQKQYGGTHEEYQADPEDQQA